VRNDCETHALSTLRRLPEAVGCKVVTIS
jgi:hypothetical protein